jgi:UDP-N-acetylglucosamine 1-carboxyvinyltransferase
VPAPPKSTAVALKSLGMRMREVRRARGLTQEQLAAELGMLAPNYARVEQGRQNVTIDTVVRVAQTLGVPLVELFRAPRTRVIPPGRPPKAGP